MALTKLMATLNKISTLATTIRGQASTVKAAFDHDANVIKDFINDTLIPEIEDLDAQNVKLTGNQTVEGVKTFTSNPIVPTPTENMQISTKKYVDDMGTSKSNDLNTHKDSSDHDERYYTETELNSTTDNSSGADKIGVTPIPTLEGENAQAILESIKDRLEDIGETNTNVELSNSHYAADGQAYSSIGARCDAIDEEIVDINSELAQITNVYYNEYNNLQTAFDNCNDGDTLFLPANGLIDLAAITVTCTKKVNIVGNKCTVTNGTLLYGSLIRQDFHTEIRGIIFDNVMLQVRNVRKCDINCIHKNISKAIYFHPEGDATFHSIAQLKVSGTFENVDYNVFSDNAAWDDLSDLHFENIISNYAKITHFHLAGCDGFVLVGSTLFFSGYDQQSAIKEKHVHIGQCNFVIIEGNNLFESGKESIYLGTPKKFTIANNNFARIGQREPSSCIVVSGVTQDVYGSITGNTADYYTKHFSEINVRGGLVQSKGNALNFSTTNPYYYGVTLLTSFTHYNLYNTSYDSSSLMAEIIVDASTSVDNYKYSYTRGKESSVLQKARYNSESITYKVKTFVALMAQDICLFTDAAAELTSVYCGLVIVTVKAGALPSSSANESQYILHIYKSSGSNSVVEISKLGLLTGGGASHPSFTFSINTTTNALQATPIASTAGDFTFAIRAIGDIIIG